MELSNIKSIYLDSNCLIYYFEGNPKFSTKVENIFSLSVQHNISIFSSELTLMELLVLPIKQGDKQIIKLYKNLDKHIPNFNFLKVDKKTFEKAAEIRAKYNYRSPGSIHLACSFINKCQVFVTSDKKLKGFKETKIQVL